METTEKKVSHTPGPWGINRDIAVDEPYRIIVYSELRGSRVALCYKGNNGAYLREESADANAKLIAAAPDMLRVIQEADAWLSFNTRPDADQIRVFRKSLQEVIQKATE